ncbi:hypothetical protein [Novosphingobium sp. AP12]|uniref:hypothetical protein n=1 Tax=Novosphingobium sp. AP12 TaxID=1144305 RepID=UPI00056C99F1|nr:hypothetical protein [Novosphingobium sp. AP12]
MKKRVALVVMLCLPSAALAGPVDSNLMLDATVESLSRAPQLAGGRAAGLLKVNANSVTLDMWATAYKFDVQSRAANCVVVKAGKSCTYDLNIGLAFQVFGGNMARSETGWQKRTDVFRNVDGQLRSATLDAFTARLASSIGDNNGSSGRTGKSDSEIEAERREKLNKCMDRALSENFAPVFC